MNPRTTVVKFRDLSQQPDYERQHPDNEYVHRSGLSREERRKRYSGTAVAIFVEPVLPDPHWVCGVERIWMVPDEEVVRLTGKAPAPGKHVYVCEHQVEID